ncbi:cytochrome c oxidase assembly protein [Amycolatopsis alkalitolerans]|uniref:Cytochrome c oxidase assembly protein n=1 Tax=Amycolatopsis alkalitolerans TaxID=2547244 RepID=A0A5C4LR35_9PSEU|nr:cytochrome c oxidase assembly protein [Amycolatopsis alkalitolerans]TNC20206.1 cytochrome c oxidase assembly protein [Amycolatopsis alkalitolerans]
MAPFTWHTPVTSWAMPIPAAVVLAVATLGYLWLAHRRSPWPRARTAWFLAGIVVTALAMGGGVNAYAGVLFSMHMIQHLLLIMVAPAFFVLAQPLRLLGADGRALRVATHPAAAFVLYTAVVVGTHLTPFQQSAVTQHWLHGLEEVLYLVSGYLLLVPVLGEDGVRRPPSHLLRLTILLAGMMVDTIVGLTLLLTSHNPFPAYGATVRDWGPGLLDDLHQGGAIMWVGGDVLMAALAIVVITRWVNSPGGGNDLGPWLEAARRSAVGGGLDSGVDIDDDEEALRAYNAMLSRLEGRDRT